MNKVHEPGRFLAGIAGVIRNADAAYLMLKRVAERDHGDEVWECVTGRVNQGEGFEDALHREVMEETRLRVRIDMIVGLSHFYRGEQTEENELQGVIFGCTVDDADAFERSGEHSDHRWMRAPEAVAFLTAGDPGTQWFRKTIERTEALYAEIPVRWGEAFREGITV